MKVAHQPLHSSIRVNWEISVSTTYSRPRVSKDFTFQVPPDDRSMMYEIKILGLPRIRMLKVHDSSCAVEASFEKAIRKCYASYDQEHEDKETTIPDFRKYSSEGA